MFGTPGALDHVLFVDDDMRIQKAFRRLMDRSSIPAVCVGTLEEALVEVDADPMRFGAVVSDLVLDQDNGLDVLEAVAERAPWAARVLVSGQLDLETALEAVKRCRVSRMLTKPWSLEELRDVVREGIDRAYLGIRTTQSLSQRQPRTEDTATVLMSEVARVRPLLEVLGRWSEDVSPDGRAAGVGSRVARYGLELARWLDLDPDAQEHVQLAALLHRVGRLGAAPPSLHGTASLDTTGSLELAADRSGAFPGHPRRGWELLDSVPALQPVAQIVHEHLERFDGLGMPKGLAGEEICLGARIVRLALAFDQLSGWPRTREEVVKGMMRLQDEAGAQLDPKLVRSFRDIPVDRLVALTRCEA